MSTVSVGIDEYGALVKDTADGAGVPIGTILPYAGNTAPEGTLMCNGAAISRTTYAELFAAIGTTQRSTFPTCAGTLFAELAGIVRRSRRSRATRYGT